jgi:hypothetical protein
MKERGDRVFREVHRVATTYHWSRQEILGLSLPCRLRYLMLIEAEDNAALVRALDEER